MSPVAEPKQARQELRRFDHVVSLLLALIVFVATGFISLLSVWLANRVSAAHIPPRAMEIISLGAGDDEGMSGNSSVPGELSLPTTEERPLEGSVTPLEETEVARDLTSVVDAANKIELDFADPAFPTPITAKPSKEGSPGGEGSKGSGRGKGGTGFGGENGFGNVLPHEARWTIGYPRQAVDKYAALLDYFGIQLGVVRGDQTILVSQLSKKPPKETTASGPIDMLRFEWEGTGQRKSDVDLLRERGINVEGASIVQLFPKSLEQMLGDLEVKSAERPIDQILKTVFIVRPIGADKYEFTVHEITYAP